MLPVSGGRKVRAALPVVHLQHLVMVLLDRAMLARAGLCYCIGFERVLIACKLLQNLPKQLWYELVVITFLSFFFVDSNVLATRCGLIIFFLSKLFTEILFSTSLTLFFKNFDNSFIEAKFSVILSKFFVG